MPQRGEYPGTKTVEVRGDLQQFISQPGDIPLMSTLFRPKFVEDNLTTSKDDQKAIIIFGQ